MPFEYTVSKLGRCGSWVAILALVGLVGCGTPATPAEFQAGSGDNPLDNAVISDDGNTLMIALSGDGTALQQIDIATSEGDEVIAFRAEPASNGAAVPSQVSTARGNSVEIDDSGVARITTTLPFQTTSTTFTVDLGENPFERLAARSAGQTVTEDDCASIRDSIDLFCEFFQANVESTKEELIQVATDIAVSQVDESLAPLVPGFVSDVINDVFDTVGVMCDAWSELRTGTDTTAAVDPCDLAP